jgi:threonine/homoserine/homoserine lactone efflux protein
VVAGRAVRHRQHMPFAALNPQLLATFCVTAAVIIAVPGPSVMFIVGRALTVGRPAAIASAAGNTLGNTVQGVLAAVGIGSIVSGSPFLYNVVKYVGAMYLVRMGFMSLRGRHHGAPVGSQPEHSDRRRMAKEGFVVGLTNPKTVVFFVSTLPQFVDPTRGNVIGQMLLMMVVFGLMSLVGDTSWSFAGAALRTWSARSPQRIESMFVIGGLCIMGLGLLSAISH